MQKTSCSRHTCMCGIRCIKCSNNFVERANMVCHDCQLLSYCENCNTHSTTLYHKIYKLPNPFTPHEVGECVDCYISNVHVNRYGVCEECNKKRTLSRTKLVCASCFEKPPFICSTCNRDSEVLIQGKSCPECHYSEGWEEHASGTNVQCLVCSKVRPLNRGCVCKNCYSDNQLARQGSHVKACPSCGRYTAKSNQRCSTCQLLLRKCASCQNTFVPTQENQWECEKCQPRCSACSTSFNRQRYYEHQCSTCTPIVQGGDCALCRNPRPLDSRGVCFQCGNGKVSYKELGFTCVKCRKGRSVLPNGLCHSCSANGYLCPICEKNRILNDSLICQQCELSSRKQYKLYAKTRGRVL